MIKKIIIFIFSIFFLAQTISYAETIVLKSGKTVEGNLIEKTDKYIKIDFQGVSLTYFVDEIKSIDGEGPVVPLIGKGTNSNVSDNNDTTANWYRNDDFSFKIKKLSGWDFKENKFVEKGVPLLSLGFQKLSRDGKFNNTLIITITKISKLSSPLRQGPLAKGAEFIIFADSAIQSATKHFNNLNLTKETIAINGVSVREAKFNYTDSGDNMTCRLLFFEPIESKSDIASIFVLFKCRSEDYPVVESDLEKSLMSVTVKTDNQ